MPINYNVGKSDKIATVGERFFTLGFKLIGIEDAFEAYGENGVNVLQELEKSGKYSVIMVSEALKEYMDVKTINHFETSMDPLVLFIPLPGFEDRESVEEMAKRILGVDIGR
ncbi:V-type ATP synthase subunit F [Caldiplasma sukawensis]